MDIALRVFRHQKYREAIRADEVLPQDLTDLVCKCPVCDEIVDWVASNASNSMKPRQAHFRHRQESKELALMCEKRVKNYSPQEIQKLKASLAQSRSQYIRREFWRLLTYYFTEILNFPVNYIIETASPWYRKRAEEFTIRFRDGSYDTSPFVIDIIDCIFRGEQLWFSNPVRPEFSIAPSIIIQNHFKDVMVGQLNRKLHEAICLDVVKFLKEQKSWEICVQLFILAMHTIHDAIKSGSRMGFNGSDGEELHIVLNGEIGISTTYWYDFQNQYITYTYALAHVLTWTALTPYNKTIEELYEKTLLDQG